MLVLLAAVESVRGDQPLKQDFAELKRLHSVLELSSFPSPSQNGVRFWLQESVSRGTVLELSSFPSTLQNSNRGFWLEESELRDLEEWPLDATLSFFGVTYNQSLDLDLKNIAIISDNGLSVRFVDFKQRKRSYVKRGDVVAFLLSEQGILHLYNVDAGSLLPFLNEIRSSCGEPKLTLCVDASKNAIVFRNSTSSTAETKKKLQRWIRNVEPGKLRKR
jgi:hypothetical protein